jgi:hypothetical protein
MYLLNLKLTIGTNKAVEENDPSIKESSNVRELIHYITSIYSRKHQHVTIRDTIFHFSNFFLKQSVPFTLHL